MLKSYRTKQGCDTGDCVRVDCGGTGEFLTFAVSDPKMPRTCAKTFGPGRLQPRGFYRYEWVKESPRGPRKETRGA